MKKTNKGNMPWVDKYRPNNLDKIIQQDEITTLLKETVKTGQMPNLLFYGSPGVGKCFAKDTEVMMYDGTIKFIQNIRKNDLIMGDDNKPRTVLSTTSGIDMMYKIKQTVINEHIVLTDFSSSQEEYIVNSEHIICLKLVKNIVISNSIYYMKNGELTLLKSKIDDIGSIINIKITDYINKSELWKSCYKGYSVSVDFPSRIIGNNFFRSSPKTSLFINSSRARILLTFPLNVLISPL